MDDRDLPRGVTTIHDGPVHVYFDGACETREGVRIAAFGYTVEGPGVHYEDWGLAVPPDHPHATNNVAEYAGAIGALEWLAGEGYTGELVLIGDSQLVIRQFTGEYAVRKPHLLPYHERLAQLCSRFRNVEFRWVRREENRRADELSKRAVEEADIAPARYQPG
jgi:ribonuclease HI